MTIEDVELFEAALVTSGDDVDDDELEGARSESHGSWECHIVQRYALGNGWQYQQSILSAAVDTTNSFEFHTRGIAQGFYGVWFIVRGGPLEKFQELAH